MTHTTVYSLSTLDNDKANKWINSIIPSEDMVVHLSGSGNQRTPQLSSSVLYVLIGKVDMHIVSGNSSVVAATSSLFWPANTPNYFIPSPNKLYISVMSSVIGSSVDAYVSIIENNG